jgi:flagellar biosynthesis regulator FlaF
VDFLLDQEKSRKTESVCVTTDTLGCQMHRSSKIYKDTANIVANPREVEANLLHHFASRLQANHWEEKASELMDALLYNRRLWTIFLTSVTHASVRALFVAVIHQASRIWKASRNVG